MALRLIQLNESHRPAFEALLAHSWRQNWGPELARALIGWRYYDRPLGGGTWLACNDGQCVAMFDSFVRPYLLDGRRILIREGCDWYCLPKYRPIGLGMTLLRESMARPEPGLSISGSDATQAVLPRLGWTKLPDVQSCFLPVKARGLAGAVLRNRWPEGETYARAIPGFIPLRLPRPAPAPPFGLGRVVEWRPGTPAILPIPQQQGLVALLDQAHLDWIARMPAALAQPLGLSFFLDDSPVGFSLSQIEPAVTGSEGRIVHLQIAHPAQAVVDWVVAETASHLVARGVGMIRCWTSTPQKLAALRKTGFAIKGPLPSYWLSKSGISTPSAIDAGFLSADNSIPFPALRGRYLARRWATSHQARPSTGFGEADVDGPDPSAVRVKGRLRQA
jgi:hypothetical protein